MAKKGKIAAAVAALALLVGLGFAYADEDEEPEDEELDDDEPIVVLPGPGEIDEPDVPFVVMPTTGEIDEPEIGPMIPAGPAQWDPTVYEHPNNYPTHGLHHQVVKGDIFGGKGGKHNMAWAALYEAAYEAAIEHGQVSDADARVFASALAGKAANRAKYINLILCAPSNDLTYGTWGFGSKPPIGEHGRSIRLLKIHPDNRSRIMNQQPPIRNIELGEPADKRTGTGGAIDPEYREEYEYLWFPRLNTERLWDASEITTEGVAWPDGSSMMLPPPEIWDLGINTLEPLPIDTFGCMGAEEEVA